jgi:hypothetical protein
MYKNKIVEYALYLRHIQYVNCMHPFTMRRFLIFNFHFIKKALTYPYRAYKDKVT